VTRGFRDLFSRFLPGPRQEQPLKNFDYSLGGVRAVPPRFLPPCFSSPEIFAFANPSGHSFSCQTSIDPQPPLFRPHGHLDPAGTFCDRSAFFHQATIGVRTGLLHKIPKFFSAAISRRGDSCSGPRLGQVLSSCFFFAVCSWSPWFSRCT